MSIDLFFKIHSFFWSSLLSWISWNGKDTNYIKLIWRWNFFKSLLTKRKNQNIDIFHFWDQYTLKFTFVPGTTRVRYRVQYRVRHGYKSYLYLGTKFFFLIVPGTTLVLYPGHVPGTVPGTVPMSNTWNVPGTIPGSSWSHLLEISCGPF